MPVLKGLTWKHDRGLAPLVATAAEFASDHPDAQIEWEARSLQEFGDSPLVALAETYDLVVIDHPFVGSIARQGCFLPLDHYIADSVLVQLAAESAGPSHLSYYYDGHQWALAIDAAAQAAAYRPDLLEEAGAAVPQTWDDVFELARLRRGFVSISLTPVDALICFFTLCASRGEPAFSRPGSSVIPFDVGEQALEQLHRLGQVSVYDSPTSNPIRIWERMSTTDDIAYCPLAFAYSNYARDGYRLHRLCFGSVPLYSPDMPSRSTLGGTGLAISSRCIQPELAVEYAKWIAGSACQRTTFVQSGGQPGNRVAWADHDANAITGGFFEALLPVIEAAWVRPRFAGFIEFQNAAAECMARFLRNELSSRETLVALDDLYANAIHGACLSFPSV